MLKQTFAIFLILGFLTGCQTDPYQNFPEELKQVVEKISGWNSYATGPFEFGDPNEENYDHPFFYLRDSTSRENQLLLTDYPSPVVRIYSIKALAENRDPSLFSIVKKHMGDTTQIEIWDYDYGWLSPLGEKVIELGKRWLEAPQRDSLRDILFLDPQFENWVQDIFRDFQPLEKYYERTRQLAEAGEYDLAYPALAVYQKQKDIPLIKKGLEAVSTDKDYLFEAVEYFPDTAFLPILMAYPDTRFQEETGRYPSHSNYYLALARFQRSDCLEILEQMSERKQHASQFDWEKDLISIFRAIHKYKCPMYEKLTTDLSPLISKEELKRIGYPEVYPWGYWWEVPRPFPPRSTGRKWAPDFEPIEEGEEAP